MSSRSTQRGSAASPRPSVLGVAIALALVLAALVAPAAASARSTSIDERPYQAAGTGAPPRAAQAGSDDAILSASTRAALQKRLDGIQKKYGIPGVSVAITFADGSTWLGTSGLADVGAKVPVTPDTEFAVASISETFTAALVMSLVEEGSIGLETSAARYLPDLDLDPAITVRQLLDHTSGIRDFFFHRKIDAVLLKDRDRRWDPATSLRYVGKRCFKPGKGWHYSNTNYLLLGMLVERVGGAPLGQQLRARFFEPLGLTHTTYQPSEAARGPLAHGYTFASSAKGARPTDLTGAGGIVPFTSVVTAAAGAGGIASSAIDLARWARAVYDGNVLEERTVATMLADIALTRRLKPSREYGLGVIATDIDGRPTIGHSGRLLGSQSVMRYLPDEGVAIAVLTNQSRTDPGIIARALLKIALRPVDGCTCAGVY